MIFLKNCPFCGGKAELSRIVISEEFRLESCAVRCTGCGVISPYYSKQEEAAELWNTRRNEKEA